MIYKKNISFNSLIFLSILFNCYVSSIDRHILSAGEAIENGERRIVVVIASYNNKNWYKQNLDSIFKQKYENYRIIYIDDKSPDKTGDFVEAYIKDRRMEHKVLLIKNTERCYKMANTYRAYHLCNDRDIILELDGDDWVRDENVLNAYNRIYSDPNVWMTYGHFMEWPTMKPQIMREIPNEAWGKFSIRNLPGCNWAGLRTYYAWLVKQIKVEDLLFNGKFLSMTSDAAIMFPMFEMAQRHAKFLTDMMLMHNVQTDLNDHKVDLGLQWRSFCYVQNKMAYQPLEKPILDSLEMFENVKTDLIIESKNAQNLTRLLDSLNKIRGLGQVYVVTDNCLKDEYSSLMSHFPSIVFNWKSEQKVSSSNISLPCNPYVIYMTDDLIIQENIDLNACIKHLEATKALAFFFTVQKEDVSNRIYIEDDVYGWQFGYDNNVCTKKDKHMVLLRSSDLKNILNNGKTENKMKNQFVEAINNNLNNIGLFLDSVKVQ